MKRRVFVFIALLIFLSGSLICSAQQASDYKEHYDALGVDKIKEYLSEDTRRIFEENGIDPSNYNWVNKMSEKGVFSHIKDFLSGGMKRPLKSGAAILAIIIITAAITSFGTSGASNQTAIYACTLACGAIIASSALSVVTVGANAMKGCSTFMLAFVPVFAAIVTLSGHAVTSVSMSTLLLGASEAVSMLSSFFIVPFMGGYLSLSIGTALSPIIARTSIADTVKKVTLWTFSLASTAFVGILGIQTAVNSAADSLAAKTAKFVLGTAVPISGTVLAEAATSISASMGLLKSSIGIYGVVALAFTVLPILFEIAIWRVTVILLAATSDSFSLPKIGEILRAFDAVFAILFGLLLLVAGLFIISLTVIVSAGRSI